MAAIEMAMWCCQRNAIEVWEMRMRVRAKR